MPRPRDDLRLAASWPRHPKTKRLRRALGAAGPLALAYLWCWAVSDGRLDGDLTGMPDGDIEEAADWEGEPGVLVDALHRFGWLDGAPGARRLHDWADEQPWLATREERRAAAAESGSRGGRAAQSKLTDEERSERARAAAAARWEREREGAGCGADAEGMPSNPSHDAEGMPRRCEGMPTSPAPAPAPAPTPAERKKGPTVPPQRSARGPSDQPPVDPDKPWADPGPSTALAVAEYPKPKRERKPPTGPAADAMRAFDRAWADSGRPAFAWDTKHAVAMAKLVKAHPPAEIGVRVRAMLASPDPWIIRNASPTLLVSKWNELGVMAATGNANDAELRYRADIALLDSLTNPNLAPANR